MAETGATASPRGPEPDERLRAWGRIGRETPASWIEANAVEGRRLLFAAILERLRPVANRTILAAGIGLAPLARILEAAGASVRTVDFLASGLPDAEAAARELRRLSGDAERIDAAVAVELFEELPREGWPSLARALGDAGGGRLLVASRVPGIGSALLSLSAWPGPSETIDPVALLRTLHLATDLRLVHRQTLAVRTYRAELVDLARPSGAEETCHP